LSRDPDLSTAFEATSPQGLEPDSSEASYGAAEAAPLQSDSSEDLNSAVNLVVGWNAWTLVPLVLVAGVFAVPYFLTHGFLIIAFALHHGFALICHQRPERSFWIFGAPVAVCARCLGIYLGAAIGLLLRTSRQVAVSILISAAAMNVLDVATELVGLHGNWLAVRFALGLALGAAGGLLISSAVADAVAQHLTATSNRYFGMD
jgi:uncharacterized membrane protein